MLLYDINFKPVGEKSAEMLWIHFVHSENITPSAITVFTCGMRRGLYTVHRVLYGVIRARSEAHFYSDRQRCHLPEIFFEEGFYYKAYGKMHLFVWKTSTLSNCAYTVRV